MNRILFFGPKGSNTQIAAEKLVDARFLEPVGSIKRIIDLIDQNPDLTGVVPIENSIEGTVRETIDSLIRTKDENVKITQEIIIPIEHCLITRAKDLSQIKKVYSHPQALAQCSNFLHGKIPMAEIIAAPNTAEAVKIISREDESFAAISNEKAAEIYGIPVLARKISDETDNRTRFVLIGRKNNPKTGKDKTSFVFATINKPGALADVMTVFKKYDINLSHIDSRPSKKEFGAYSFFIECDMHIEDESLKSAMKEILQLTVFLKFLGAYPKFFV